MVCAGRWGCPGPGSISQRRRAAAAGGAAGAAGRRSAPAVRAHRGTYGSPRITADLASRVAGQREHRRGVDARAGPGGQGQEAAPCHDPAGEGALAGAGPGQTGLRPGKINQKWYGDGTEIPTAEGKLHLASVMDMASRRVLGFALGEHHDAQLAYGALVMAVAVRGGQAPGVVYPHRPG